MRRDGAGVAFQEIDGGRHDVVYCVEDRLAQDHVRCLEVVGQMVFGARPDDYAGHGRVVQCERNSELDEGQSVPCCQLGQSIGGVQLALVERSVYIESAGKS